MAGPALNLNRPVQREDFGNDAEAVKLFDNILKQKGVDGADAVVTLNDIFEKRADPEFADVVRRMVRAKTAPAQGTPALQFQIQERVAAQAPKTTASEERAELREFRAKIDKSVVGQHEAKDAWVDFYQRYLVAQSTMTKPFTALMPGPPGVGKTLTVEALSDAFHQDKEAHIFVDCTKFTDETKLNDFFGVGRGIVGANDPTPFSLTEIRRKFKGKRPILIHIDEPDKMPSHIASKFWANMQAFLNSGTMQVPSGHGDGGSNTVRLTPAIVTVATNAGADNAGGLEGEAAKRHYESSAISMLEGYINSRIDAVIPFLALSQEERQTIAQFEVNKVIRSLRAVAAKEGRAVRIDVDAAIPEMLAKLAGSDLLGARPIGQAVNNLLAVKIGEAIQTVEDGTTLKLQLSRPANDPYFNQLAEDFERNGGKVPGGLRPQDFPADVVITNPPPQIHLYNGAMPKSDWGPMTITGGGLVGQGRSYMVAKCPMPDPDFNEVYLLQARTMEWTKVGSLPPELAQANLGVRSVTLEPKDGAPGAERTVLMMGHHINDQGKLEQATFIYDPSKGDATFEKVNNPPVALSDASLASAGGKALLWGGRLNTGGDEGFVLGQDPQAPINHRGFVFDIEKREWRELENLPSVPRAGAAAVNLDGKIVLLGGEYIEYSQQRSAFRQSSRQVDIFDPATETFSSPSWQLPSGVDHACADIDDFGRIRLKGGSVQRNRGFEQDYLSTVLTLDPVEEEPRWRTAKSRLPFSGSSLASVPNPQGGVFNGPFHQYSQDGDFQTAWVTEKSPDLAGA